MNDKIINEELLTAPIGTKTNINQDAKDNDIYPDYFRPIKVELNCPYCKATRIFSSKDCNAIGHYLSQKNNQKVYSIANENCKGELLIYKFSCEMNHNLNLMLEVSGKDELIKVGQWPEPIALAKNNNDELLKELDEENIVYYLNALKSRNNNLNIASFVYLRRIFEKLIDEAKKKSKSNFDGKKIKDVIKILVKEGLLNSLLNDMGYNVLYSLISDGVHNLSEIECQNHFDLLKEAIEIILEDEIYRKKQEKRKKRIGNELNNENSIK